MKSSYIIAALVLIILAGGAYMLWGNSSPTPAATNTDTTNNNGGQQATTTPDTATATTTVVKIALLDTTGNGTGKTVACDNLVMVTRTVPATTAPLTAAIAALYAEPEGTQPSAQYNFIARTKSTLKFDHATVSNGTANLYFTGSLSGLSGVCDDPRAKNQFEQTALQFPTVTKVQFYLNGTATTLIPSQQ
jgi:hypothetical protein